ncbi:MAG: hypothetical protein U5S82_24305 [Gammaproteobacteria bacterium]|nr:hypothetical protein [Gammaproteobacteria bacterium]
MTIDIGHHVLGKSAGTIGVGTSEEVCRVATALVSQARFGVDIVTRDLDPAVYDDADFLAALKAFVLERRRVEVRILVRDPMPAVRRGHRLIPLAQQLSTFFAIRVPARHHRDFNQAFLVVDGTGYVHRELAERYDGTADFNDRLQAKGLQRLFEEMWEAAVPSPELRRMPI